VSAATGARVALRERTGLEAADLGFAMARRGGDRSRRPGSLSCCPGLRDRVAVARLRRRGDRAALVAAPAFARIPLHVLSLELFGERATLAERARALPRLLRSGLFTSLVTRRLS